MYIPIGYHGEFFFLGGTSLYILCSVKHLAMGLLLLALPTKEGKDIVFRFIIIIQYIAA
jgi:hypothetical protein